ncbi:MAG TPA: hypothetical protein P5079_05090 [Elusimicrobiota bacterium]|nr:hypothetical protein [Elusimicrobiota bacterium]
MIPHLDGATVLTAAQDAVKAVNQAVVPYLSRQIPLLDLKLQSNTICAVVHNLLARGISELNNAWQLREKGSAGGDLGGPENIEVEIKTTTDRRIKGNRIKLKTGYFICLFLSKPAPEGLTLREVRCGYVQRQDWHVMPKTQFAYIKPEVIQMMDRVFPATETAVP